MSTVKGGVWTNIEDEILKASISKYGLNQWARVSSLLARKSAKQCKARWESWLDPSIRKTEWSKDEDEKLLHLAKLMPTQWRTIAPIVGRTPQMCLERYQKLLDEAEQRESNELGLTGVGDEAGAPSADSVRKLRAGELDPEPETKPARPDTIDLDEDEKDMLSEARARLANTQGKKAKRKARERQLEQSRRVAALQKRRELKMSGINIKLKTAKKGEMDYNADIPFERKPAEGFYDVSEELEANEKEKDAFDPRKQQLAIKRKGDPQEDELDDRKRRKGGKDSQQASLAAAMKAGQAQKLREAEQQSKRRGLVLPAPQVSEAELDDIVKMGVLGSKASRAAADGDNDATRGLIGNYNSTVGATPLRTPMAPKEEDRIANELRNIRALNETQSVLLGGDNTDLIEGSGSTGFAGATPSKHVIATPNPMATPRQPNGTSTQGPGATPLRTPRDTFSLNKDGQMQLVGQTPRDIRNRENSMRQGLLAKLAALPKPKATDFELELPEEQEEDSIVVDSREDAAVRDAREKAARDAAERAEFLRQTQVVQRRLPRPAVVDMVALTKAASQIEDPIRRAIALESAALIVNDAAKFTGSKLHGKPSKPLHLLEPSELERARALVDAEHALDAGPTTRQSFITAWTELHASTTALPGLTEYSTDEVDEHQLLIEAFDNTQESIMTQAEKGAELESKLTKIHGGYANRAKMLRQKINEAADALAKTRIELETVKSAALGEDGAMSRRLDALREEVAFVRRRERESQEEYRRAREELDSIPVVNGVH